MTDGSQIKIQIAEIKKEMEALRREIEIHLRGSREALNLARTELERRLESMNEFRAQIDKQTETFARKSETDLIHQGLDNRLRIIEREEGKREGSSTWSGHIITTLIGSIIGLIVILIVWFVTKSGVN